MGDQDNVSNPSLQGSDASGIPNNVPSSLQDVNFDGAVANSEADISGAVPQQAGQALGNQVDENAPVEQQPNGQIPNQPAQAVGNEANGPVDAIQFQPQNPQVPTAEELVQSVEPPVIVAPPQKSSGKKVLFAIIIIFIVLILGAGGIVYATEAGYIKANLDKYYTKTGIQQLWGGLPYDGKQAMAVSVSGMGKLDTFHLNGKLSVTISEPSGSDIPFQTLLKKGNKVAFFESNGVVLGEESVASDSRTTTTDNSTLLDNSSENLNTTDEIIGDTTTPDINIPEDDSTETAPIKTNNNITFGINVEGDLSDKDSQLSLSLDTSSLQDQLSLIGLSSLVSSALRADILMVDKKVYFRIPALSVMVGSKNNKWYGIDLKDLTAKTDMKEQIISKITGSGDVIKSGEKVGIEDIAGVKTNKYHLELDTARLGQLLVSSSSYNSDLAGYTSTLDVWVGKKDHLIHKFVLVSEGTFDGVKTQIKFEMNLSKFNVALDISAPDASQVDEDGIMGIQKDIIGLSEGTAEETGDDSLVTARMKARDAQRKSDLRSLKAALEVYASDYLAYPIDKERVKLSDAGNVLETSLVDISEPYITKLPIDPSPDKYYYGYKCVDGKNYELTAVLENSEEVGDGITKSGDLTIYTLTND